MAEVADTGGDHDRVTLVRGGERRLVLLAAAGVCDECGAGFDGFDHTVGEWKEAVGGHDAAGGGAGRIEPAFGGGARRDAACGGDGIDAALLTGADTEH